MRRKIIDIVVEEKNIEGFRGQPLLEDVGDYVRFKSDEKRDNLFRKFAKRIMDEEFYRDDIDFEYVLKYVDNCHRTYTFTQISKLVSTGLDDVKDVEKLNANRVKKIMELFHMKELSFLGYINFDGDYFKGKPKPTLKFALLVFLICELEVEVEIY